MGCFNLFQVKMELKTPSYMIETILLCALRCLITSINYTNHLVIFLL